MTDRELIRKVVDKAAKSGYIGWKSFAPAFPPINIKTKEKMEELISATLLLHKEEIIFSHGFAEYYWGGKLVCPDCGGNLKGEQDNFQCQNCAQCWNNGEKNWRFHLQKMVLEKKRLGYLGKYL